MHALDHFEALYVPETEVHHRIRHLQSILRERGIPLAWIDHPTEISYFAGSRQNGVLLIPEKEDPVYYAKKSLARAERESPLAVEPYPGWKRLMKEVRALMKTDRPPGLSLDITPALTFIRLAKDLEIRTFEDLSFDIRHLRSVKSVWEIEQIEAAADQASTVFDEMDRFIVPGHTELQISASIEGRLRELGHGATLRIRGFGSDLPIITVVGGNGALEPTNFDGPSGGAGPYPFSAPGAGRRRVRMGETLIVDMVTAVNGYYADHSRVFHIGSDISERTKQAHAFCLSILHELEKRIAPGAVCSEVYETVWSLADSEGLPEGFMGFGENRVRFFGHGVGLELDEYPILAPRIDLLLQENMVIAVEPKAYLPDTGPVGVENTYVVTSDGCRSLCQVDPEIRIVAE